MSARWLALIATAVSAFAQSPTPATPSPQPPVQREIVLPAPPVPDSTRFSRYFAPLRTENAVISPDGRYLAFSIREQDKLYVITTDLDHPGTAAAKVLVADSETSTPILAANQYEKTPPRITWMQWVSATRIIVQTNRATDVTTSAGGNWTSIVGAVLAFDFNGANSRVLVAPKDLREELHATPELAGAPNPFSLTRQDRAFEDRINSPDRPANDPLAPVLTVSEISDSSRPGPHVATIAWRGMQVQRLDPARPGSFLLLAFGAPRVSANRSIELLSIDGKTGNQRSLTHDMIRADRDFLIDQQGHLRVTIPNAVIPDFPHFYEYFGETGHSLRRKLGTKFANENAFSVTPENFFGEREIPLGFDHTGELLYYASNRGRSTFGIFSRNLTTGKTVGPTFEQPTFDLIGAPVGAFPPDTLVFNPHTQELVGIRYDAAMRTAAWLKPEWREVQGALEHRLPGCAIDILNWDAAGRRFVVATQGPANAGVFYVFDRETNRLSEFARRAPWLDATRTFATLPFGYTRADGIRITGLITVPSQPRLKPIPVVVVCPDVPWQHVRSDFRSEIHALTDMGFAVVQTNGRGAWGLGVQHREALKQGYDLVQIEDIVTTLDELNKRFEVNLDRVALFGRGHGGFIALRALQDYPTRFRCAVALDAPINLADWLKENYWTQGAALPQLQKPAFGNDERLSLAPLAKHPEKIIKPILLLSYPGPDGAPRGGQYLAARAFAYAARKTADVSFEDLPMDYARGLPGARSDAFAKIEEFLNLHIYSYQVKPGELREVKEPAK